MNQKKNDHRTADSNEQPKVRLALKIDLETVSDLSSEELKNVYGGTTIGPTSTPCCAAL